MKRKALLLAAKPEAFEGPPVLLRGGRWRVETSADFRDYALVRRIVDEGESRHPLNNEILELEGPCVVRAVLLDGIEHLGIRQATVQICRVE